MSYGYKHLVECHCVLPQFRHKKTVTYHKFAVFSVADESDTVSPHLAQCNNCGTVHRVFDVCKSEILAGKDESRAVEKKEDVCLSLPSALVELFASYRLELPDYQFARFILENEKWDSMIVLTSEHTVTAREGELVRFVSQDKFRVEPFSSTEVI